MSLVFNAKTFTSDSFTANKIGYIGAAKTVTIKDDLALSRVAPKPVITFSGVGRVEAKLTRTWTLTGALTPTGDAIVDINVSVPAGFASADVDAILNDMGAFLSGADFKTLVKTQKITF
jgi:hypothetical protein